MKTFAPALLSIVLALTACGDGDHSGGGDSGTSTPGTTTGGSPIDPSDVEFLTHYLPSATANRPYQFTLKATGGTAPYTYLVHEYMLPPGLALNNATGLISGTPAYAGTWTFFLRATDTLGTIDVKQFEILVGVDFLAMGTGWHTVSSGTTVALFGVDFTDANTGWIVGWAGTARRTTNGGIMFEDMIGNPNFPRWGQTHLPTDPSDTISTTPSQSGIYHFTKVDALSASTAWIGTKGGTVNGFVNSSGDTVSHILRTTDGSTTWDRVITMENEYIAGVQAFSATDAKVVSRVESGLASNFVNIGASSAQWHVAGPTAGLQDLAFVTASKGVIVGQGVWRTTNGGASWTVCSVPAGTYRAAAWIDATTVVVVGSAGTILRSTDSGVSWSVALSGGYELHDVSFVGTTGWAVGLYGTILRSADGGVSWTSEYAGTSQHLYGVSAVNATTAWAVGAGGTCIKRQ